MELAHVVLGLAALPMVLLISRYYAMALWHLVWRPYAVARSLGRQGIRGPPYTFAVGSLKECKRMVVAGRAKPLDASCHNYTSLVQPFFQKCTSVYGKTFLFWLGPIPSICSTDIELVKEVFADRANLFQMDYLNPSLEVFFGKGLVLANGDDWKRHRKVVHPVFNQEKLKSVSALASEGARQMMDEWSTKIQMSNTYKTEIDMRSYSAELALGVIEGMIFGQKTKESGEVFVALKELEKLAVQAILAPPIPRFRYLPTHRNRQTWKLDKLVTSKIMKVMETRLANNAAHGEDLLGLMIQARGSDANTLSNDEIVGECKTFFAAGTITSTTLLAWAMFLISIYPQWQEKIREEILGECQEEEQGEVPSINTLGKLKLLNMVLLETLRASSEVLHEPASKKRFVKPARTFLLLEAGFAEKRIAACNFEEQQNPSFTKTRSRSSSQLHPCATPKYLSKRFPLC